MDLKKFFEQDLNQKLAERETRLADEDGIYQIEVGEDTWHLNMCERPLRIQPGTHSSPDCAVRMSVEDLEKLTQGKLNVAWALMTKKISFRGDMKKVYRLKEIIA